MESGLEIEDGLSRKGWGPETPNVPKGTVADIFQFCTFSVAFSIGGFGIVLNQFEIGIFCGSLFKLASS